MEDNFDEVNRQDDGNKLLEAHIVILRLKELEVSKKNVLELLLAQVEYFQKDFLNLFQFKYLVFVWVVSEEYNAQLIHNHPDKSVPRAQAFILF